MSFIDKAKEKADDLKEKLPDSVKEKSHTVKEKAGDLAEKLSGKVPDSVKEKLDTVKETVKDKLHRNGGENGSGDTGVADASGPAGEGLGETPTTGTDPVTPTELVEAATDAVGDASAAGTTST